MFVYKTVSKYIYKNKPDITVDTTKILFVEWLS